MHLYHFLGSGELKERQPLMLPSVIAKQEPNIAAVVTAICTTCSSPAAPPVPPAAPPSVQPIAQTKAEMSIQTEADLKRTASREAATQTVTQWLQISLAMPPLSLTQEVPDVMLWSRNKCNFSTTTTTKTTKYDNKCYNNITKSTEVWKLKCLFYCDY
jgi:hypothetical protein